MGTYNPESLLDICAKVVAYNIPFQRIEERYDRIPEPVQMRIIFWSFPRNVNDIFMYSSLANDCALSCRLHEHPTVPFYEGLRLYENGAVDNVIQIGFHLSGTVTIKPPRNSILQSNSYQNEPEKKFRVSITFDRCKITSVTCTCETKDIFWCKEVVALTLYRIRNAEQVILRVPISETLLQLDRQQLQKLAQYLISEHHTLVLPTAQRLADEILQSQSSINRIMGAPDPTAGSCADDEHSWHLDEEQVSEQVKSYLNQSSVKNYNNGNNSTNNANSEKLNALFAKVKEMLRARDSNAARMLRLITEQFIADPKNPGWRLQANILNDKYRAQWDQLGALWVCVVLNPHAKTNDRLQWRNLLEKWSKTPTCPLEDANNTRSNSSSSVKRRNNDNDDSDESDDDSTYQRRPSSNRNSSNNNAANTPRTIFHQALEASTLTWEDPHLRNILENNSSQSKSSNSSSSSSSSHSSNSFLFNSQGYPLWNESIATACARVEALRCHGYRNKALRLAVAIVRTMKRQQREWQFKWQQEQDFGANSCNNSGVSNNPIHCNREGWLGNPLDPIGVLFDTLADASLNSYSKPVEYYYGSYFTDTGISSSGTHQSSVTSNGVSSGHLVSGNGHAALEDNLLSSLYEIPYAAASAASAVASVGPVTTQPVIGREKPHYKHIMVPGSRDRNETYLCLAIEAALIGLGQQRLMPGAVYAYHKAAKQEERLIKKLKDIDLDSILIAVLRKQAMLLLEGGPFSGLGCGIHLESVPMHYFATYLLVALLPYDTEFAYNIGLRAMRLPILENPSNNNNNLNDGRSDQQHRSGNNNHNNNNNNNNNNNDNNHHYNNHYNFNGNVAGNNNNNQGYAIYDYPVWNALLSDIESQQCTLAKTMLEASKNDVNRLREVLESAQRNIHSYTNLYQLAQHALRIATDSSDIRTRHTSMITAAFELGLQVLNMTLSLQPWKREEIVLWMIACATDYGFDGLISIMQNWFRLFTPLEATNQVAKIIISNPTFAKLNLNHAQQMSLRKYVRTLVIQCSVKDPPNCALTSLHICEGDPEAFDAAFKIVVDAGSSNIMSCSNLFAVAKFMESRGHPSRAYKLACLAIKSVHITHNGDKHPNINDIHWACTLALSLGTKEISQLIPTLVKNVQCAPILADILRRCSMSTPVYRDVHSAIGFSEMKRRCLRPLPLDKAPLRQLLEATICAYASTTHSRLAHISPKHYMDFIEFLTKARETFILSPDGSIQFQSLIENMKIVYKGKKKLMFLVKERFG